MDKGLSEGLQVLMANRFYLYRLMHLVFGYNASSEILESIGSDDTIRSFALLSAEDGDVMSKMSGFSSRFSEKTRDPAFLDQARSEYTKLFIGPGKLIAYPWESMYIGNEKLLFQQSTLRVRNFYRLYGYQPLHLHHSPDDHIALMMDFMARMSRRALEALESGDCEMAVILLHAQELFMKEHLQSWIPEYAEDLTKSETALLYPQFGQALKAFLEIDGEFMAEALEILEDTKNASDEKNTCVKS